MFSIKHINALRHVTSCLRALACVQIQRCTSTKINACSLGRINFCFVPESLAKGAFVEIFCVTHLAAFVCML